MKQQKHAIDSQLQNNKDRHFVTSTDAEVRLCDADERTETTINFKLQLSIFNHYRNTTIAYNILMDLLKRLVIVVFREKNCIKH